MALGLANGGLWLTLPDGERHELIPTGPDELTPVPRGAPIRVERDAAGRVVALATGGDRLARVGAAP